MQGMGSAEDVAALHFHRDMLDGCQTLKKLGYWPAYFHREVANNGGVQTAKNLLAKTDTSEGFATLWSLGRLDLSVEAFVLLPWYEDLFSDAERRESRRRLEGNAFDVERFLRGAQTPQWAEGLAVKAVPGGDD